MEKRSYEEFVEDVRKNCKTKRGWGYVIRDEYCQDYIRINYEHVDPKAKPGEENSWEWCVDAACVCIRFDVG